ncbi:MAG: hypothetical protein GVX78_00325 [Bacteroidetes bacterium]|jgi:trigger factor|nr:hypothetical protein [Bacteroidota bacterium]
MKSNILEESPYLAKFEVTIEHDDYSTELNNKLKEKRKGTSMKGFRPGKAPMRLIHRMYGQSFLVDIINQKASDALKDLSEERDWRPLGEMDMAKEQTPQDFNSLQKKDYTFVFDVGLLPSLDLKGLDGSVTVPYFKIDVDEEQLKERWDELLSQAAEQVETEGPVKEGDVLTLEASELNGDQEKDNGWISNFSISVDLMEDDAKKLVIGAKLGDTFDFDIYKLEKNTDAAFVEKHLLKIEDESKPDINSDFKFEVMTIKTKKEVEVNQETFDKIFGEGEISSETEALAKIKESTEMANKGGSDNLFYWDAKFKLLEANDLEDLPDDYAKKYLLDDKTAANYQEEPLPQTVRDELSWSLITQNIAIQNKIQPSQELLIRKAQDRIHQMLQGQALPESVMNQLTKTILDDQEQMKNIVQEATQELITDYIKDNVTVEEQPVSEENFKKEVDRINKKVDQINHYLSVDQGEEE